MSLNLTGVTSVDVLPEGTSVLVNSPDGKVRAMNAGLLGKVFANTSLFESYQMLLNEETDTKFLTTSNKIKKYLARDTTSEFYIELEGGRFVIKSSEVQFNDKKVPLTTQATDCEGNLLYWSDNPEKVVIYDDKFPWKNSEGKVFIYPQTEEFEASQYPVMIYSSLDTIIFEITPKFNTTNKPYISFDVGQHGDKVNIMKSDDVFSVVYGSEDETKCGFTINKVNGTSLAKLSGIWDGVNTQNVGSKAQSLNTLNKAILYLKHDTSNQSYTVVNSSEVSFYTVDCLGGSSQLQDDNNNLLYWTNNPIKVSNDKPMNSSNEEVYLTTVPTGYMALSYDYGEPKLVGSVSFDPSQNTLSVEHSTSNSHSQMVLSSSELTLEHEVNNKSSSVTLNGSGGVLTGDWSVSQSAKQFTLKDTYDKTQVYNKDETYNKDEVYSKDETYSKDDVYNKSQSYSKQEINDLLNQLKQELTPTSPTE